MRIQDINKSTGTGGCLNSHDLKSLRKEQALHLDVGNTLILKEIQATILYSLELNIEIQIRQIHNYEFVGHVGLGCEFTNIKDTAFETIKRLVEWGLNSNDDRS